MEYKYFNGMDLLYFTLWNKNRIWEEKLAKVIGAFDDHSV